VDLDPGAVAVIAMTAARLAPAELDAVAGIVCKEMWRSPEV